MNLKPAELFNDSTIKNGGLWFSFRGKTYYFLNGYLEHKVYWHYRWNPIREVHVDFDTYVKYRLFKVATFEARIIFNDKTEDWTPCGDYTHYLAVSGVLV